MKFSHVNGRQILSDYWAALDIRQQLVSYGYLQRVINLTRIVTSQPGLDPAGAKSMPDMSSTPAFIWQGTVS